MKLIDMINEGAYAPSEDSLMMKHLDDKRRPKLTLRHLHALRLSNEYNKNDKLSRLQRLPDIYNPPEDDGGDSGEPDW
jgi:hypothetical protein